MTDEDLHELIRLVQVYVPPVIEERLPRALTSGSGRCLPSTRVGLETLRYFGVLAEPMPTRALAVNAAWQRWQHEEGGEPPMPEPSWSVAVGAPETKGPGVNLHLVLAVEGRWLLDLDSIQFSRPARSMTVPKTLFLPLREVRSSDGDLFRTAGSDLEEGGRIDYVEHPAPPAWKHGSDYRKTGRWAGPVIRQVREEWSINRELHPTTPIGGDA